MGTRGLIGRNLGAGATALGADPWGWSCRGVQRPPHETILLRRGLSGVRGRTLRRHGRVGGRRDKRAARPQPFAVGAVHDQVAVVLEREYRTPMAVRPARPRRLVAFVAD